MEVFAGHKKGKVIQMEQIRNKIREAEQAWKEVFSVEKPFNANLHRWQDEVLYDMYDHNQFVPIGEVTKGDLEKAFTYQKEQGWNFIKYDSRENLDSAIVNEFGLEECEIYTMLLSKKDTTAWKTNSKVVVKDIKEDDIGNDIKELEIKNYASVYGLDFTERKMNYYIKKAKETEGFHYLAAYLDGKIVGTCYVFAKFGYVVMDSLIVNEEARKQYVATTMMKYITEKFDERMFLHADADDTPKDMYARMGFEVVDSLFEYCKTW